MLFYLFAACLAGFGVCFIGMHIASENVKDLITPRVQEAIVRYTRRDIFGSIWGFIIGFITQETSVVTFVLANLCSNGHLTVRKALSIVNWNNPGGCILVFFVFLNLDPFIMMLIGILGVCVLLDLFKEYQTHIKFFLGLCLLLYGLILINENVTKILEIDYINYAIQTVIQFSGITTFILGGVIAFFAQSFIAFILAGQFVKTGIMDMNQAFMLISGVHFGLALNTNLLFATFKGIARQVMMAQVFFDFLTGLLLLALTLIGNYTSYNPLEAIIAPFSNDISIQIITLILLANLTMAFLLSVGIELVSLFLSRFIITTEETEVGVEFPVFVTPHLVKNPSSAAGIYYKEFGSIVVYLLKYLEVEKLMLEDANCDFDYTDHHKKLQILFDKLKKTLLQLICQSNSADVIVELNKTLYVFEVLTRLEENLFVKTSFIDKSHEKHEFSQHTNDYIYKLLEAEETIFFVLQGLIEKPDKENAQTLEMITRDHSQLVEEALNKFLLIPQKDQEQNGSKAMFLSGLFERDVALIHDFAMNV